jgi:hypothetical protein
MRFFIYIKTNKIRILEYGIMVLHVVLVHTIKVRSLYSNNKREVTNLSTGTLDVSVSGFDSVFATKFGI